MSAARINRICIKCNDEFMTNSGSHKICARCKEKTPPQLCGCNCGKFTKAGNQFIHGHAMKGKPSWNTNLTKETDERVAKYAGKLNGRETWNKSLTKETDEKILLL